MIRKAAKRPLAHDPEYMRQRRLRLNPDVRSRIGVKVRYYLTYQQATEVEKIIDRMIDKGI